jgi:hypothetical protein
MHNTELMIAERTKLLNQEQRKAPASIQSVTDKTNRLTNRKATLQKPMLNNEISDKPDKVVTKTSSSNHSTNKNASSTTEGKLQ